VLGNGIAKDLSHVLHCPLCQIGCATALDHFDHSDEFRGFNLSDRVRTKQRQTICIHAPSRRVYGLFSARQCSNHSPAIVRKEFSAAAFSAVFAAFRCSIGSRPVASSLRASAWRSLASARGTSGYLPKAMSFSLPSCVYAYRHSFPPAVVTQRQRLPLSLMRYAFSFVWPCESLHRSAAFLPSEDIAAESTPPIERKTLPKVPPQRLASIVPLGTVKSTESLYLLGFVCIIGLLRTV
jgi:hypothetical protein